MSYLLQALFWCPKCWRVVGYWMLSICGAMLLVGWRISKRAERIENKTSVVIDLDKVLAGLPFPIPVTSEGFALAAVGTVLGATLALAGRWAQRF